MASSYIKICVKINILATTFKSLQTLLGANEINLKRAYIVTHKAVSLIGFHSVMLLLSPLGYGKSAD